MRRDDTSSFTTMRSSAAFIALLLVACGSSAMAPSAAPPPAVDVPLAVEPSPSRPPPPPEPEPAPTDPFAALFEPDPQPADPPVEPVMALSAPLRAREASQLEAQGEVVRVRYPVIELPDVAARADLDARLQGAVVSAAAGSHGMSRGRCRATLATAELVSVLCELTTASGEGASSRPDVEAITFRLGGEAGARRVSVEDAFVPMSRLQRAICTLAAGPGQSCTALQIALAPDHLVVRWRASGEERWRPVDVPYAELASLMRRDGILAFAATDAPGTSAAALAGAPEPCRAWGPPRALQAIGSAILQLGRQPPPLVAIDVGGGLFRAVSTYPSDLSTQDADALTAALGAPETVECAGRLVVIGRVRASSPVMLFPAPDEARAQLEAQSGTVPAGAHAIVFDRAGPGRFATSVHRATWTYVVGEQASGWAFSSAVHRVF